MPTIIVSSDTQPGPTFQAVLGRPAQSLSITVEGHAVTVVNVHLTCGASPCRAELGSATEAGGEAERLIVVGDMNSFANPWLNRIVGWFCGFGVSDMARNEI
jgi:endonuclease/exonuclease/phosphatase family metal-dependent hydrolase